MLTTCGVPLVSFLGIGLLVVAGIVFFQPGFVAWVTKVEEQGWFYTSSSSRIRACACVAEPCWA